MSQPTIRAAQLVFTNVEAGDSKAGQRGFQVWQASKELADVKRDITRRVDDYRLPAGVAPADQHVYARDCYFPLADKKLFAVARTVPLPEKDKFGRGGRFFAHVLVVEAEDFKNLHFDPFQLLDAAAFLGHPDELKKKYEAEWKTGEIPGVDITIRPDPRDQAGLPGQARELLVGHCDREPDKLKTVVVVGKPADVAAELRKIFRALPPQLRRTAAFDTLSVGSSLTQVPCTFAGCPTADALKMWAFRRFVRFDTATQTLTPAADPAPRSLLAALTATEVWDVASSSERSAAWDAAGAIHRAATSPDALKTGASAAAAAGPVALSLLQACTEFPATLKNLSTSWEKLHPAAVIGFPGVGPALQKYLKVGLSEQLRRLGSEPPREIVAEQIFNGLLSASLADPDRDVLTQIRSWHDEKPVNRRLGLLLLSLLDRVNIELTTVVNNINDPDSAWLKQYLSETLKCDGRAVPAMSDKLAARGEIRPEDLAEAELLCDVSDDPAADLLRFQIAFHRGRSAVERHFAAHAPPSADDLLKLIRPRIVEGWTFVENQLFLGFYVYPSSEAEYVVIREIMKGLSRLNRPLVKHFLREMVPEVRPVIGEAPLREAIIQSAPVTDIVKRILDAKSSPLSESKTLSIRNRVENLSAQHTEELLAWLRSKMIPGDCFKQFPAPPFDAFRVGWEFRWMTQTDASSQIPKLVEIVLGLIARRVDVGEITEPIPPMTDRDRFMWLLRQFPGKAN
ncbi:hypothetical protein [Fimbriiglobus ruber]|uniref:GTPase-associated protein 1 N-terminal domain-containing protein n=1 Tax=Fimbriiglobus ruber TaxID=1908690 RepID=A0A225DGZ7_9BACT|nr:hypothetical protein [Fimbriiglobus ruber]OWK36459.1 hypothetical protein FRUB_09022 [Fimbriiglobus ruber]